MLQLRRVVGSVLLASLLAACIGCGDDDGSTSPEGTAEADATMGTLLDLQQVAALSDSLFDYDPTLDPAATPEQNAQAVGMFVMASLGGCGSVSVSGAVATIDLGPAPGCTLRAGLSASGQVTASVSQSGGTTTVVIDVSNATVNGRRLSGTYTFSTTSGSSFTVTSSSGSVMVTLSGSPGAITTSGTVMVATTPTTVATMSDVVWRRGDCYPSAGTLTLTTGPVTQTITFSATTASTGVATRTVGRRAAPYMLPAYGRCPSAAPPPPDAGPSDVDAGPSGLDAGPALPPTGLFSISCGGDVTCAVDVSFRIYCWGANDHGQLGRGTTEAEATVEPVLLDSPLRPTVIACSTDACCVTLDGPGANELWCWGLVADPVTGVAADTPRPVRILPLGDPAVPILSVSIQGGTFCASQQIAGASYCWGDNTYGQLGDGATTTPRGLAPVPGLFEIQVGDGFACGQRSTTTPIECWGRNDDGQLGRGTTSAMEPTPAPSLTTRLGLAVGRASACGFDIASPAECWGRGDEGQIGDGALADRPSAVTVGLIAGYGLECGGDVCCATETTPGEMTCWGSGPLGSPGVTSSGVPVPVTRPATGDGLRPGCAGRAHVCALTQTGSQRVFCWGDNSRGQLGMGMIGGSSETPVQSAGGP